MADIPFSPWHICASCEHEFQLNSKVDSTKGDRWQEILCPCPSCWTLNEIAVPPVAVARAISEQERRDAKQADKEAVEWLASRIISGNGW